MDTPRPMNLDDLSPEALHERAVNACQVERRCRATLIALLVQFDATQAYRQWATSLAEYGETYLDLKRREVQTYLCLGKRLAKLPRLRRAFDDGEVRFTKAREVARVAIPETDHEWTTYAQSHSSRIVERAAARCRQGDLPPKPNDPEPPKPGQIELRARLSAADGLIVRKALKAVRAHAGESETGMFDDGECLAMLARHYLGHPPEAEPPLPPAQETCRVVLQQCPTCETTTHVGHNSPGGHEVAEADVEAAACDAELMIGEGPKAGHVSQTIPPATRRRVLHRDHYHCAVPGCRNDVWLELHHIVFRSEGGAHDDANLCCLCSLHHKAVHKGRLSVWRSDDGTIEVARHLPPPPVLSPEFETLREMLTRFELRVPQAAEILQASRRETLAVLVWLQDHGEAYRVPGGGWFSFGSSSLCDGGSGDTASPQQPASSA